MLCQNCKTREANTHIRRTVGNKTVEMFLCPVCAKESGFDTDFSISNFLFSDMLSSPFMTVSEDRCPSCHTSFSVISKNGNVGCGDCYKHFEHRLMPTVSRLHSSPVHKGKVPKGRPSFSDCENKDKEEIKEKEEKPVELTTEQKIEKLKNEQAQAITCEDFEKAAILRDKIKELEGGNK